MSTHAWSWPSMPSCPSSGGSPLPPPTPNGREKGQIDEDWTEIEGEEGERPGIDRKGYIT